MKEGQRGMRRTLSPLFRSPMGLLALANLAICGAYAVLLVALVVEGLDRGADYTAFYTGWRVVLEGHGSTLYDPATQAAAQRAILGGLSFQSGLNPFNLPPYAVLPFVPLGLLPLTAGYLLSTVAQVGLLLYLIRKLLGHAHGWSPLERLMIVGWLLGFPSLAVTFYQSALSLLVAVAVLSAYLALVSGRNRAAGAWLVLASIKPQVAIGPAVAAILARRPTAIILVGGGVVLAVVATAALGIGIWAQYLGFIDTYLSSFDRYSVDPSVMWNLRGTLTLVLGRGNAGLVNGLAYLGFVLGLAWIAFLWRHGWRRDADIRDRTLRFGFTIVLTLLLSPHLNPHDDLLLVIAAALAYGVLRGSRMGDVLAVGASLAPVAILLANGLRASAPTDLPIRVPTLIALGLAGLLMVGLRETKTETGCVLPAIAVEGVREGAVPEAPA